MNLIAVVSNNFDALITVVVLIMSIILFIKNTIAPELTGLLCVGIFIATGVLSPEKALAGFGSPSLITLMGLFAVSSALFKSAIVGVLLFSGSLYAYVLTGVKALTFVTPVGGMILMIMWGLLGVAAFRYYRAG